MKLTSIFFSKFNSFGLIISLVVTFSLVMITSFVHRGFNLGIDFSSGQNIGIQFNKTVSASDIELQLIDTFAQVSVSQLGNTNENQYNIKIVSTLDERDEHYNKLVQILEKTYGEISILGTAYIGPSISQNLLSNSLIIVSIALLLMLLYIWLRFKIQFAISAILALLHDAIFIIFLIGALQIEVTVSTAAAVLTIIGYSINDTIVIFDRIRENSSFLKDSPFTKITDTSITQTLSRTVITSLTTLLAVLSIYFFAIGDIKNFALVLVFGILEGTWSSIFLATPLLYILGFDKRLSTISQTKHIEHVQIVPSTVTSTPTKNVQSSATANREYIDKVRLEVQSRKRKKNR